VAVTEPLESLRSTTARVALDANATTGAASATDTMIAVEATATMRKDVRRWVNRDVMARL